MSKVSALTQEFPRMPSGGRNGPTLFYTPCCSSCPDCGGTCRFPRGHPAGAQLLLLAGGHSSESTVRTRIALQDTQLLCRGLPAKATGLPTKPAFAPARKPFLRTWVLTLAVSSLLHHYLFLGFFTYANGSAPPPPLFAGAAVTKHRTLSGLNSTGLFSQPSGGYKAQI